MWFKRITGFEEKSPENVYKNMYVDGAFLVSRVTGERLRFGELRVPTLGSLRKEVLSLNVLSGPISVGETVASVEVLHSDSDNKNALFQAASQFNLLEMVGPEVTPEYGIDCYEFDKTQGPACAIACGAGTIYRNYFVEIEGQVGQTSNKQIDCLSGIGKLLGNEENSLWTMRNGYALANKAGLVSIQENLANLAPYQFSELAAELKVGIHWETEVTVGYNPQNVSQIYCSALPIAYCAAETSDWEPFARLILEATYEATFLAGLLNMARTGSNKIFLTLVGGGAFGNEESWIIDSIATAIHKFRNSPLEVKIVSYGKSNPNLQRLLR